MFLCLAIHVRMPMKALVASKEQKQAQMQTALQLAKRQGTLAAESTIDGTHLDVMADLL